MAGGPWILVESYEDAAARSYLAGIVLEDFGDPATAAHLYGVAAECAVKYCLESAGITIDKPLKVHFPILPVALGLHGQGRTMLPLLGLLQGPPVLLSEYSIHSRYAADNCIDTARCGDWKADVQIILTFCGFWI
ncbi:hypothetical protein [Xanthobacter flavus]|uniref:hypothetical protein n=1 Tax=Xanthobacter flavus TaxID=281 RepID=UPI003729AE97